MTVHANGTTHPAPLEVTTQETPPPSERRGSLVAAVVKVDGDLYLDDGTSLFTIAGENLSLNDGGGALFIAGEDFHLTNGGCACMVAGRDIALRNGGSGFVLAGRAVHIDNGEGNPGAGVQSALVAAREVNLHQSRAGVILAGSVNLDGNATVVVEITPERVAGAIVGLFFYLPVRFLQRFQGK